MSEFKNQVDKFLKAVEEVYETPCRVIGIPATFLYITKMEHPYNLLYCSTRQPWKELVDKKNQTGFRSQRYPVYLPYNKAIPFASVDETITFGLCSDEVEKKNFPTDLLDVSYGLDGFHVSDKSLRLIEKKCFGLTEEKPELIEFFQSFQNNFKPFGNWSIFEDEKLNEAIPEKKVAKPKKKKKLDQILNIMDDGVMPPLRLHIH